MDTPIGKALEGSNKKLIITGVVASILIVCDLVLVSQQFWMTPCRFVFLLIAIYVYDSQMDHDSASLGLTLRPVQGYYYWIFAGILIGIGVLLFIGAVLLGGKLMGREFGSISGMPPSEMSSRFYYACINAPILEEAVYRLIICVPATRITKPTGAIVISGSLFAALHFVYGNPSPDNFIAGFFLAWAYLKSGSLFVPVVLHACGNLFVLLFYLGAWYVLAN